MKIDIANYQGRSIRYTIVSDNGILFNTVDICSVLGIAERPPGTILGASSLDMVDVIQAALSEGKNDMDFVEWLEQEFIGYVMICPIHPNWDDNWKLK